MIFAVNASEKLDESIMQVISSRQSSQSFFSKVSQKEIECLRAALRDSFLRGEISEALFLIKLKPLENFNKKLSKTGK